MRCDQWIDTLPGISAKLTCTYQYSKHFGKANGMHKLTMPKLNPNDLMNTILTYQVGYQTTTLNRAYVAQPRSYEVIHKTSRDCDVIYSTGLQAVRAAAGQNGLHTPQNCSVWESMGKLFFDVFFLNRPINYKICHSRSMKVFQSKIFCA